MTQKNTLLPNYSLKEHNTFGLEVKSKFFVAYDSESELIRLLDNINKLKLPILQIGEGSNLLFTRDFDGIALHSCIEGYQVVKETAEHVYINVGGGIIWDNFVEWCVNKGYGGIENLSVIPGTVGASPVQNIGAYGVEAQDVITEVETIELATGNKRTFSNQQCEFAYRHSIFKTELKGKYAVTSATYKLDKTPTFNLSYGNIEKLLRDTPPSLKSIRKVITEVRDSKLPNHKVIGNAGSFFKNPYISTSEFKALQKKFPNMPHYPINVEEVKVPAGWLIDQAGFKGKQHKGAAVHKDQALVLINNKQATGNDIVELARIIISKVEDLFGITLSPEVNIIG